MRDTDDPHYKEGILEINDELEMLIGQIKMLLFTNTGEVLGQPDFGINLEEQLFTFNLNESALKTMLQEQTVRFIPLADKYNVQYQARFVRGTTRDMCVIDISINNVHQFGVFVK